MKNKNDLQNVYSRRTGSLYKIESISQLLSSRFSAYCLSALYKTEIATAHKICEIKIIPQESWAKQLDKDTFLTYVKKETPIKITCAKRNFLHMIHGVNRIYIPECTAVAKNFELFGQKEETINVLKIPKPMTWNIPELKQDLTNDYIEQIMTTMHTSHPVHITDLKNKYHLQSVDHWYWHLPSYVILLGIITFLIIASYCIYKHEKKERKHKSKRRNQFELREDIPTAVSERHSRTSQSSAP